MQTLFFPDNNGEYIPLMFTGFVSYSSKANLGKKNHELEYENCQKQAYNLDFSSLPKKFRILHYYNTMQVRVPSKI